MVRKFTYSVLVASTFLAGNAIAADKSHYNLFNPTPEKEMRGFSTDRPGKIDTPYTVDAGHFQIETDVVNFTRNRVNNNSANTETRTTAVFPTYLKAGLTNNSELQLLVESYFDQSIENRSTGNKIDKTGFGDIALRYKYNLVGNDEGAFSAAIIPSVRIPTNQDNLGNERAEWNVNVPLNYNLADGYSLSYMFIYNYFQDGDNAGYHHEMGNVAKVTKAFTDKFAAYTEIYTLVSSENKSKLVSTLDFAATYLINKNTQLDAGINFGLTEVSDDINPFIGISYRF